jgi:APA family basic amino acid/polyamine antiporter
VRLSGNVQNVLSVAKLAAIAFLALLALRTPGTATASVGSASTSASTFLFALLPVFMTYGGWYTLTFLAGDVRRPERTMTIGIVGGIAVVIATYALINAAYMKALTVDEIAASPAVAAALAERVVGRGSARFMALLVLISAPGVVNVVILAGSRLYYAMARDGLFFESAARLHPRYGSPVWSIAAQAGWSAVLLLSHTYGQLLQQAMFGEWTFFALTGASVFVFAKRDAGFFSGPGERAVVSASAAAFTAIAAAVVVNTLYQSPRPSLLGVALILAGLPVYRLWRRDVSARPVPAESPAR